MTKWGNQSRTLALRFHPWSAGNGRSGKSDSGQSRATDRVFGRDLLAGACKLPRLYRAPRGCEPPSNPTSTLTPAAPSGARDRPAQTLLTAREFHDLFLLACAGMAVNIHTVHPEQAELLLDAAAAPAVRFWSADAARPVSYTHLTLPTKRIV